MASFTVMRQHIGDRFYAPGDVREANSDEVRHLVKNGVLAPTSETSESAPSNKAIKPPSNKSAKR